MTQHIAVTLIETARGLPLVRIFKPSHTDAELSYSTYHGVLTVYEAHTHEEAIMSYAPGIWRSVELRDTTPFPTE